MEANAHCGHSLTIPLILDNVGNQQWLGEKEAEPLESISCHTRTGTTSFFKTLFNGLNALSGTGMLSITYALASGGWLSMILLTVIAITAFYTGLLIIRCMDVDPQITSYPDIGECAFGSKGRLLVSVFMNTELYLVATGFLILEGDNLHNLFPDVGFEIIGGRQCFVIMVGLIIMPTVWFNHMGTLSYISVTGVLASAVILGSILWTGAFDGIEFNEKGTPINWNGIPTAASLFAFCYCAHPVFPTLYTSMRSKHQFSKVLLLCFLLCTIGYASMAAFGYLMFGSKVESQITLNLPIENLSSRVAIYTTLINPISKFALVVTPIVNSIENQLQNYCRKRPFRLLIRTILVISSILVALTLPFFGYLMSLVGAFLSVTASTLLPCLCYLKISRTYQRLGFDLVIISGIMLLGISIVIFGTYTSVVQIIAHL